jgi:phosphoribosylformylglycinamidine cyclo-ligase
MAKKTTYAQAGVNIDAGNEMVDQIWPMLKKTYTPGVIENEGGYGGLFSINALAKSLGKKISDPILVSSTDGVGTKLKIAFLTDKHDTVGIDLVAMCVNDIIVQGARPMLLLDYFATGKLKVGTGAQIVKGIAEGCRQSECALIGGETAEMPGFYPPGEYDLAGFTVGIVDRKDLLTGKNMRPGDIVIGVASSGLHSNGYSLARRVLLDDAKLKVSKKIPEFGCTLGEELLRPTVIYVKALFALQKALGKNPKSLRALAHITGGGLVENIPRVLAPKCGVCLFRKSWNVPAVFQYIQKTGGVPLEEMDRVFNMGIGLVVIVAPAQADTALKALSRAGYFSGIIGEVRSGKQEVQLV